MNLIGMLNLRTPPLFMILVIGACMLFLHGCEEVRKRAEGVRRSSSTAVASSGGRTSPVALATVVAVRPDSEWCGCTSFSAALSIIGCNLVRVRVWKMKRLRKNPTQPRQPRWIATDASWLGLRSEGKGLGRGWLIVFFLVIDEIWRKGIVERFAGLFFRIDCCGFFSELTLDVSHAFFIGLYRLCYASFPSILIVNFPI